MVKKSLSRLARILFVENRYFLWTLLLTAVFFSFNYILLSGSFVAVWDADGQFMPYQVLIGDYAGRGAFPLWDVWTNGGMPISGDPQIGVFSPINYFIGFLFGGSTLSFRLYWLFVWWLGGFGVLMLARHLKTPAFGGGSVALGFQFCGVFITNAEHTPWLVGFSFLPLIVWRFDAALLSKRFSPAVQAGALWGVSALASYPAYAFLTISYCGLWAVGRMIFRDRAFDENFADSSDAASTTRPAILFVLSALFVMLLVGIAVFSPTYVSFIYESAGYTGRTGALTREVAVFSNSLHPGALSTFSSPFIALQKVFNKDLWSSMDVSMSSIYAGPIIFVSALFALSNARRIVWRWWLFFLGLAALAFALGEVLPFRGWLYDFVYPTRFFRHPAVFRSYYLFSATVLALYGARDLALLIAADESVRRRNFKLIAQIAAVAAISVFIITINSITKLGGKIPLAYVHVFVAWGGIACLGLAFNKFSRQRRAIVIPALICGLAIFDAFCVYRLSIAMMATNKPEAVERWRALDRQHSAVLDLNENGWRRAESACYDRENTPCEEVFELNNDQLINKIPVFHAFGTQENVFQLLMARNPILKGMATGTERVWFSAQAAQILPTVENYKTFADRAASLGRAPLVVHSPEQMLNAKFRAQNADDAQTPSEIVNLPAVELLEVKVINYLPEELTLEAETSADGWLLVTDRWARAWTATVNDQPAPIYGGNFIFRAVKISAGRNVVRFVYRPFIFPYLLILSWGTLAAIFIFYPAFRLLKKPNEAD